MWYYTGDPKYRQWAAAPGPRTSEGWPQVSMGFGDFVEGRWDTTANEQTTNPTANERKAERSSFYHALLLRSNSFSSQSAQHTSLEPSCMTLGTWSISVGLNVDQAQRIQLVQDVSKSCWPFDRLGLPLVAVGPPYSGQHLTFGDHFTSWPLTKMMNKTHLKFYRIERRPRYTATDKYVEGWPGRAGGPGTCLNDSSYGQGIPTPRGERLRNELRILLAGFLRFLVPFVGLRFFPAWELKDQLAAEGHEMFLPFLKYSKARCRGGRTRES